jgi:hypothetical protein
MKALILLIIGIMFIVFISGCVQSNYQEPTQTPIQTPMQEPAQELYYSDIDIVSVGYNVSGSFVRFEPIIVSVDAPKNIVCKIIIEGKTLKDGITFAKSFKGTFEIKNFAYDSLLESWGFDTNKIMYEINFCCEDVCTSKYVVRSDYKP